MELKNNNDYINHIPGFMLSAENVRLLKNSEFKHDIKEITEKLIKINNKIIDDIVFGNNDSIIYNVSFYSTDFSDIIIKILQNLGYNVNIVHVSNSTFCNSPFKEYSLIISIYLADLAAKI